ncbi:arginine metabolism regulation protein II [Diutina catenulata]
MPMAKRSKTFTGCFTCRTRKIRCDLARPGCVNCEKAGITCGGYGIKLRWSQPIEYRHTGTKVVSKSVEFADDTEGTEFFQRRHVGFVEWERPYTSYDAMDRDLAQLHNVAAGASTEMRGPFGAFPGTASAPAPPRTPAHDWWIDNELLPDAYIAAAAAGNDQYLDTLLNDEASFGDDFNDFYNLVFHGSAPPNPFKQDAVSATASTTPSGASFANVDFYEIPSDTTKPLEILLNPTDDASVVPPQILTVVESPLESAASLAFHTRIPTTALQVQPLTRYLLNYYITEVADLMTVIPLTENPWKTVYFPRALMALGELSALGRTSTAKNALMNALLAVSAFNIQSKFPRNSDAMKFYLRLGIRLRNQASVFVKQLDIDHCVRHEKYKDVLCAIMSMISVDLVWGTMQGTNYYIQFCGKVIAAKMKHKTKLSSKARVLHRIFSSLKLIQDSTCLDPDQIAGDWGQGYYTNGHKEDGRNNLDFIINKSNKVPAVTPTFVDNKLNNTKKTDENFATDALYGLPNSLITLFADTVSLLRTKIHTSQVSAAVVESVHTRLLQWTLEWSLQDNGAFLSDMHEATYHHIMSFYHALIIYFERLILEVEASAVQPQVKTTLDHLNAIGKLIGNGTAAIIPLFWQGFIAGCEATSESLQQGFKQWGADIAQYLGSYWGARQIMLEVWRRKNHGEPRADWVNVIHDWGMNLMLN